MPSAWLGFSLSLFSLFLLLSSISVLNSLLLSDTLENEMLVALVYQALKTESTPWLISFIYYLAGQAFESNDSCWTQRLLDPSSDSMDQTCTSLGTLWWQNRHFTSERERSRLLKVQSP